MHGTKILKGGALNASAVIFVSSLSDATKTCLLHRRSSQKNK
jgi:hypothetical protein